jgi:hypothetical protein
MHLLLVHNTLTIGIQIGYDGHHLDDLKSLNPASEEIDAAASWCLSQDVSEPFRELLQSILEELGYEDVGRRLP